MFEARVVEAGARRKRHLGARVGDCGFETETRP
jgi:hypothetical protein